MQLVNAAASRHVVPREESTTAVIIEQASFVVTIVRTQVVMMRLLSRMRWVVVARHRGGCGRVPNRVIMVVGAPAVSRVLLRGVEVVRTRTIGSLSSLVACVVDTLDGLMPTTVL